MRGLVIVAAAVLGALLDDDGADRSAAALALVACHQRAPRLFPVLVLSIWWKRLTPSAPSPADAAGFAVAALSHSSGEANILGLDDALAGILDLPAGALGALRRCHRDAVAEPQLAGASAQNRHSGGEVIYDREIRLLRLKNRERRSCDDREIRRSWPQGSSEFLDLMH